MYDLDPEEWPGDLDPDEEFPDISDPDREQDDPDMIVLICERCGHHMYNSTDCRSSLPFM